ncbi:MAG: repeat containing exported protein [Labilithrix sp.]|nr:repeat containing exported protein [Labilithrix sp.]
MQADHDSIDQRLGALEVAVAEEKAPRAVTASTSAATTTPPARVVQLGGPSDSDAADPNDPAARPDIRVTGAPGSASMRPRAGKTGRMHIEESDVPGTRTDASSATRSSALDPDAKKAYEAALAQIQAKQIDRGLEGLNAFLVRWPDHPYAENAMYWRGEAYFAQGEFLRAAEQFEAVLARFGSGSKGPDALLKLGMCHDRLGAAQRAREYWDRLKNDYPRSDAAKRIPKQDSSPDRKGPKENR